MLQSITAVAIGALAATALIAPAQAVAAQTNPGALDTTFNVGSGFGGVPLAPLSIEIQPDGKLLAGGFFVTFNGVATPGIVRLNTDGSRDTTFNTGTGTDGSIASIALQPDGKVLIGGDFSSYNGFASNNIARLNADGSRDDTFNVGTGFDDEVYDVELQTDGQIVVGGTFENYMGGFHSGLVRLNSTGTVDTSFTPPALGGISEVRTITQQSTGKLVISGDFKNPGPTNSNNIARLNVDGSVDPTFVSGTGFGPDVVVDGVTVAVIDVAQQINGQLIVVGSFPMYNGVARRNIVRLGIDGALDPSFVQTGSGFDEQVNSVAILPNGQIVTVGNFDNYSTSSAEGIALLDADGTLDPSLVSGTGFPNATTAVAVQADGKFLVTGFWSGYNGTTSPGIVRLVGVPPTPTPQVQVPVNCGRIFPKKIARNGLTTLQRQNCRTNAGKRVNVTVNGALRGTSMRGDLRLYRVIRGPGGKVQIRTYGHKLRITVNKRANPTTAYLLYRAQRTYRV